jgi:hypothetical protein
VDAAVVSPRRPPASGDRATIAPPTAGLALGLPRLASVLCDAVWALRARPLPLASGLEVGVGLLRHGLNRNRDPFQGRNRSRVYIIDVHCHQHS